MDTRTDLSRDLIGQTKFALDTPALLVDLDVMETNIERIVGTCRMGAGAADAVVDARLKVHGVDRLRVVDASVFPTVTSANTNAPTVMVAQKAADLILNG